jgi:hypothetical protein
MSRPRPFATSSLQIAIAKARSACVRRARPPPRLHAHAPRAAASQAMPFNAYIVEAVRTPGGRRVRCAARRPAGPSAEDCFPADSVAVPACAQNGLLCNVHPADLGAAVVNAIVDRTKIDPGEGGG